MKTRRRILPQLTSFIAVLALLAFAAPDPAAAKGPAGKQGGAAGASASTAAATTAEAAAPASTAVSTPVAPAATEKVAKSKSDADRKTGTAATAASTAVPASSAATAATAAGASGSDSTAGGRPTDLEGPLKDKMSEAGDLFGDLYVLYRYQGGETRNVPAVDENGEPVMAATVWLDADGNPVLDENGVPYQVLRQIWTTATAVGGEPVLTEVFATYTVTDEETGEYVVNPLTGDIYYAAPYPSQCLQPVADYGRWGDIFAKTGLADNRLPLLMTYDATWERTECEVPHEIFIAAGETWNGNTYAVNVYYDDLIQEVEFGRLNLGRAPEAVLDDSFDEAIRAINNARDIKIDASGRLVLTTDIYDEFLADENGDPLLLETVEKAIDSPKENLALYLKLMQDGHLITPADDRLPVEHSLNGGIPDWKKAELEDGPSKILRPTIDIEHLRSFGLGHLVDADNIQTYYTSPDAQGNLVVSAEPCTGCEEWTGITTRSDADFCAAEDFAFAATFFASAADKTGTITTDKIVYMNSILGINQVVGYSAYDTDGNPLPDAIDYSKNPVYFDYGLHMNTYHRLATFRNRGQAVTPAGDGHPAIYDGQVKVLVETSEDSGMWEETEVSINRNVFGTARAPEGEEFSGANVKGFTSMGDDDLRVIEYIHTYQIPGLR
jgi:hypothetical protein